MNVLYQFNESYAPYGCVSMTSLFLNNEQEDDITVYILADQDVTDKTKEKIGRNAERYGRKVIFLGNDRLMPLIEQLNLRYRGNNTANYKMFIDEYPGLDVDRLLYLDSDTIVEDSLHMFYYSDMEGKAIRMCLDTLGLRHKMQLGFRREEDYYNTGVILFDLHKWKEHRCEDKILDFIKRSDRAYPAPDQDIMNVALKNDISRADLRYNLQPYHMLYTYGALRKFFINEWYYSRKEVESAMASPVILHTYRFLGEFPWHLDSLHPAASRFDRYLEKSVYRGMIKGDSPYNGLQFKVERWLYKWLPKGLFLRIFEINFAYFFWKANSMSKKKQIDRKM